MIYNVHISIIYHLSMLYQIYTHIYICISNCSGHNGRIHNSTQAVGAGSSPNRVKPMTYTIDTCPYIARHLALRGNSTILLSIRIM